MDILKKFWPNAFKTADSNGLVTAIIIYVIVLIVGTVAGFILGLLPIVGGILAWVVGTVLDLYGLVGIVLALLTYFKVIKD